MPAHGRNTDGDSITPFRIITFAGSLQSRCTVIASVVARMTISLQGGVGVCNQRDWPGRGLNGQSAGTPRGPRPVPQSYTSFWLFGSTDPSAFRSNRQSFRAPPFALLLLSATYRYLSSGVTRTPLARSTSRPTTRLTLPSGSIR